MAEFDLDAVPPRPTLTESELQRLARIERDRRDGFLLSTVDMDFLLSLVHQFMRGAQ